MHTDGDLLPLTHIIEDIEIRGVTARFPSGPVAGYQWRYRLTVLGAHTADPRDEWSPWVFGSRASVEAMIERWQQYLRDGTLGPGTLVQ